VENSPTPAPTSFSFGVVLYEMATGQLLAETPRLSSSKPSCIVSPFSEPAEAGNPSEIPGHYSKALEKDRDLRYQSAAEMRADLKRLRRDTESIARPSLPASLHR
jgi:serine/threonine protein kinase